MKRAGINYSDAISLVCNQTKAAIDEYAESASKTLPLVPGGDIVALAHGMGGKIHYRSVFDVDAELDTIFVHGPREFEIVLPEHSTPRRDRFTIAHELGHYLIHSWSGQRPLKAARNGSDRAEWEANWFAAGLIMPKTAFREAAKTASSVSVLADTFDVSEEAARVRCSVLGIRLDAK